MLRWHQCRRSTAGENEGDAERIECIRKTEYQLVVLEADIKDGTLHGVIRHQFKRGCYRVGRPDDARACPNQRQAKIKGNRRIVLHDQDRAILQNSQTNAPFRPNYK